jgi:DNA-binding CsgD family transcriptional regulator
MTDKSSPNSDWAPNALQARILEGIAAGYSSAQLSRYLYVSPKTVDYHVRAMSDTVQAQNRIALVSWAFILGILRVDSWPPQVNSSLKERGRVNPVVRQIVTGLYLFLV